MVEIRFILNGPNYLPVELNMFPHVLHDSSSIATTGDPAQFFDGSPSTSTSMKNATSRF